MPPVPWQYLLPFSGSDDDDQSNKPAPPISDSDNSSILGIADPKERAEQIARALAAGMPGANIKTLAASVLDGILGRDH